MKVKIAHGMTKEEAMARVELMMPSLINAIVEAINDAEAEFHALPRWKRWLLYAWAVPRYGPGWAWDKWRWWLRGRRRLNHGAGS